MARTHVIDIYEIEIDEAEREWDPQYDAGAPVPSRGSSFFDLELLRSSKRLSVSDPRIWKAIWML